MLGRVLIATRGDSPAECELMGRRKKDIVKVEQSYGVMPFVLEKVDADSTLNRHVIRQAQRSGPQRVATLDHDGTIIESAKRSAAMTYQGTTGYQPSLVLWAEQDLIVADEFRDGNVPAGCGLLPVARRAFDALPETVELIYYRGDTASYNHELLNWLREEKNGRPRAIFAVSADMSPQLKEAVLAVEDWHAGSNSPSMAARHAKRAS